MTHNLNTTTRRMTMKQSWMTMAVLAVFLMLTPAYAGTTPIDFSGLVTTSVVSFGDPDPNDGQAPFTGVYDEAGFRVRAIGGTWFVAGDIGDPVGHIFSDNQSNQTVMLEQLTRGEFVLSQIDLAPVLASSQIIVEGLNAQGVRLYRYNITVSATGGFTKVRLDIAVPEFGSFRLPVTRVTLANVSSGGYRVGGFAVSPQNEERRGGGKRGR